jgi:hypothetical protein
MEVLNRNQRASALWRLSGLYATTVVIMGVIVFQSWKSYQSRADKAAIDIAVKKAVEQEKKNCEATVEAKAIAAFREATSSIKPTPEKPVSSSGSVQSNLNSANNNVQQLKTAQTTVKTIGTTLNELNPINKK